MIQPTPKQLIAACAAARSAINSYSQFYSSMIHDDTLQAVIRQALVAALNASPTQPQQPTPQPKKSWLDYIRRI